MDQRPAFIDRSEFASPGELYRDPFLKSTERVMLYETLAVFDETRKLLGAPLIINSGRRSLAHQQELRQAGLRAAKFSPHCYGAALDVDVPDELTDYGLVQLIFASSQALRLPKPRVGYMTYRKDDATRYTVQTIAGTPIWSSTFVHFDYIFLMRGLIDDIPESIWENYWKEGVNW